MPSDSDKFVLEQALEEEDTANLFQAKRYTYVTDSSSNNGNFTSQLQFDLNVLSAQSQYVALSEGIISFPVKLSIKSSTTPTSVNSFSACIKNGFHQFIDSVQITLGGATVNSSQIYQNVSTTFKQLTEWSKNDYEKYGPTLGLWLDDFETLGDGATIDESQTLDNVPLTAVSPALCGVSYSNTYNTGFQRRAQYLNSDCTSTYTAQAILARPNTTKQGRVQIDATATGTSDCFVAHYLAQVRIKDLSDCVSKLPPMKNIKGFVYVNINSAKSVYTATATTGAVKTSISNTAVYGRTMPAMVEKSITNGAAESIITFTAEVSATPSTNLTTVAPIATNARFTVPFYVAVPEIDRVLSQTKKIRYLERFVTTVTSGISTAGGSCNVTLTPGITNPKRLNILPILTGAGAGSAGLTAFQASPELSPFDIVPAGSSPFATIDNLQVNVGNQPIWTEPINYDYQMFLQEVSKMGIDGGQNDQISSGILNQRLWNQIYKFYTVDLSRGDLSSDGSSKSVQLSCVNATTAPMKLICEILYEREIEVNTDMGTITQGM